MSLRMLILKPTCRTWKRRNWRMSEYGSYYQSHFNLTDVHIIQNINPDLAIAFSLDSQVDDNQSNKSKIFWANVRKDLELFNKCCNKNTLILHRKCYSYTWTITILWRKGNLVLGSQTFKICCKLLLQHVWNFQALHYNQYHRCQQPVCRFPSCSKRILIQCKHVKLM